VMDLAVGLYHFCLRRHMGRDEEAAVHLMRGFFEAFFARLALATQELRGPTSTAPPTPTGRLPPLAGSLESRPIF
jgi:hypothetical protein